MKKIVPLVLLTIWAILSGCSLLLNQITLEIELPLLPDHWQKTFTTLEFSIHYFDTEGILKQITITPEQRVLEICINKEYNTPVIAYPILKTQNFALPPAGGIFPVSISNTNTARLNLTWEMGFAAYIFECLLKQGIDLATFNTERFIEVIAEKSTGDPWSLNAELIMKKIALNDFRKTDIKKAPCRDVILSVAQGSWFLESPFSSLYISDENNIIYMEKITEGFHRLFELGSGNYIDFYLTAAECIVFIP